jgi:hypothetical protein
LDLRDGIDAYRRLGPVGFVRAGSRLAFDRVRLPARRARLRLRPLQASPADVTSALAPDWRERALATLPAVAAWEPERDWTVTAAEPIMRHEFDLLGSGPAQLGERIDWQLDFKSGRRWPLDHISRITTVYPDNSDIKVPWELCRCQHLPVLAAAWKLTGDRRYLDEIGTQMTSFIEDNPVEFGACWACTMDVAIRAANWVATLALCADQPWTGRVLQSLLLHGRFIRSHLEWGEVRGNHYLSDVAGLLPLAAVFPREGWQGWAAPELVSEMEHQVREDGCDHEASIPYHRLVTELFVRSTEAARALGHSFPDWYDDRLQLMLDFVRCYTRGDGLAPLVGDEDSGRYLPLGDYGADPRDHRHLIAGLEPARGSAALLRGGYYVLRRNDLYALIRCGDTGLDGRGGHSHNDQLSFEFSVGAQPIVVDPGAYIYTADPAARNLFRSTAFHSTMQVDGAEQNELREDYLFSMTDRAHAQMLGYDQHSFEGRHEGFPGAVHTRRLELTDDGLRIEDRAEGGTELTWTFPLAPGADAGIDGEAILAEWPGAAVRIEAPGVQLSIEDGWYSPRYGVREPTPFVRARRAASAEPAIFTLRPSR